MADHQPGLYPLHPGLEQPPHQPQTLRTSLGRWATQLRTLKTGPTGLDPEDCRDELGYLGGVHAEGPGQVGGGQDHGALRLLGKRAELFITVRPGRSR